jgi:hypothetical protein
MVRRIKKSQREAKLLLKTSSPSLVREVDKGGGLLGEYLRVEVEK